VVLWLAIALDFRDPNLKEAHALQVLFAIGTRGRRPFSLG
jgi:hypothetical protein